MTIEEFFDGLRSVRDSFEWNIEPASGWYSDGRAARRGWVRGRPKNGPAAGALLEPIGALCYAITGKAYGERSWSAAGRTLGLRSSLAAELNAASDARTWDGDEGSRRPVDHLQHLREQLLDSLGLAVRVRH